METQYYVLTWLVVDDAPSSVTFYGPYTDYDKCVAAGRKWQATHADNPCWNTYVGYPTVYMRPASSL